MTGKQLISIFDRLVLLECCLSYANMTTEQRELRLILLELVSCPKDNYLWLTRKNLKRYNHIWNKCNKYKTIAIDDISGWSQSRETFVKRVNEL